MELLFHMDAAIVSISRNCSSALRIPLQLVLFLSVLALNGRAFSQPARDEIGIRVGTGTSMTTPRLRSIFISVPARWLEKVSPSHLLHIDESIMLSEEPGKFNVVAGVTPMIRLEFMRETPRISLEAGVGVTLTTRREMGGRQLGSNFLFSPTIAAGVEAPWMNSLLGVFYMVRHLSNAGLFEDNAGVNFQYIVFFIRV